MNGGSTQAEPGGAVFHVSGRRALAWLTSAGLSIAPGPAKWWQPWTALRYVPTVVVYEDMLSASVHQISQVHMTYSNSFDRHPHIQRYSTDLDAYHGVRLEPSTMLRIVPCAEAPAHHTHIPAVTTEKLPVEAAEARPEGCGEGGSQGPAIILCMQAVLHIQTICPMPHVLAHGRKC